MNDADRAFLERFPANRRSTVSNLFLQQVRDGLRPPVAVCGAVEAELLRRMGHGYDDTNARAFAAVFDEHFDEAVGFARWCIAYEALTTEEKQRWKRGRTAQALVDAPHTAKQEEYLRALGYHGPIDNLKHASALIEIYKRGWRVEGWS